MTRETKGSALRKMADQSRRERQELLEELGKTKEQIDHAYACFNRASDPDLIESYVFEINALQRRYSYLLRKVRELDSAPVLSVAEG